MKTNVFRAAMAALVIGGVARAADPVGWWKMDDGSGTTVTDSSSNEVDGAFVGSPSWTTGKYGGAVDFPSTTTDYVEVPHHASHCPSTNITVAAWTNLDVAPASQTKQFAIADKSSWADKDGWWFSFDRPYSNYLIFRILHGTTSTDAKAATGWFEAGRWHHVAGTFDGSEIKVYVDGMLLKTASYSGTMDFTENVLKTGRNVDGRIDDVRIYGATLGHSDIQALAGAGVYDVPSPWTGSDIGSPTMLGSAEHASGTFVMRGGGANIGGYSDSFAFVRQTVTGDRQVTARVASLKADESWAKAGVVLRNGTAADAQFVGIVVTKSQGVAMYARSTGGGDGVQIAGKTGAAPVWLRLARSGDTFIGYSSSDGSSWTLVGSLWLDLPDSLDGGLGATGKNDAKVCFADITDVSVSDSDGESMLGLMGRWNFDEGTGTTAYDSSANHLDGAVTGAAWDSGVLNGALSFDGVDDRVSMGDVLDSLPEFAVSAWANVTTTATTQTVVSKEQWANGWSLHVHSTGKARFGVYPGYYVQASSGANVTTDEWHHLTGIFDSGAGLLRIHVDGACGGVTASSANSNNVTSALTVGRTPGGAYPLSGSVDDVRVYHKVLNAGQVRALWLKGGTDDPLHAVIPASSVTSPVCIEGACWSTGSAFEVEAEGPSGSIPVTMMGDYGFYLDADLSATSSTQVTITHSVTETEVQGSLTWQVTDLTDLDAATDSLTIRKGDSLLLTATGTGTELTLDADGDEDNDHETGAEPGDPLQWEYTTAGEVTLKAWIDEELVGSLALRVVETDLTKAIGCKLDRSRAKSVAVTPVVSSGDVVVTLATPADMTVYVESRTVTGTGFDLSLMAKKTGTAYMQLRLGGSRGPILGQVEVHCFTVTYLTPTTAPVMRTYSDGDALCLNALRMEPYYPGHRIRCHIFVGKALFEDTGTTEHIADTDDFDVNGEHLYYVRTPTNICHRLSVIDED